MSDVVPTTILLTKYFPNIHILYSILSTLYLLVDFFIFSIIAGFTFYSGYYGACKRPVENTNIIWYKISQLVLCGFLLVFSIMRAGSFNGWARISKLNEIDEELAKFCIFLCVLESTGYTAAVVLGIIGILRINSVFFLSKKVDD